MKHQYLKENTSTTQPGKTVRYSDDDLNEFKTLIHSRLDEARTDYEFLKGSLTGENNNGTEDTSPTFKLGEDVSDIFSKEENAQLAGRRLKYIEQLNNALIRIENKTYGICRVSGQLISKERLRTVPHTTLSMDAKQTVNGQ